jgi:hypothetical protein
MTDDHVASMFRNVFHLSESAARVAAAGRGGSSAASPFDHVTDMFQSTFGMSRGAAEVAAAGRGMSVSEARRHWDSGGSVVQESAAVATRPTSWVTEVSESAPIGKSSDSRRFRARIIQGNVLGASGWYSAEVLQEAARDRVFGSSLGVYIDHPTASELEERPVRSVRDLAGRLVEDATYQGDGLYSTIEFFPHWAPIVSAMKADVGLSIRALAEAERGEVGGRQETVITKITEALSVDVVTKAGAGGKLVSLLESVGRAV